MKRDNGQGVMVVVNEVGEKIIFAATRKAIIWVTDVSRREPVSTKKSTFALTFTNDRQNDVRNRQRYKC